MRPVRNRHRIVAPRSTDNAWPDRDAIDVYSPRKDRDAAAWPQRGARRWLRQRPRDRRYWRAWLSGRPAKGHSRRWEVSREPRWPIGHAQLSSSSGPSLLHPDIPRRTAAERHPDSRSQHAPPGCRVVDWPRTTDRRQRRRRPGRRQRAGPDHDRGPGPWRRRRLWPRRPGCGRPRRQRHEWIRPHWVGGTWQRRPWPWVRRLWRRVGRPPRRRPLRRRVLEERRGRGREDAGEPRRPHRRHEQAPP